MPRSLLALAALVLAPVVHASDYLVLSGASFHFARRNEFNQKNWGAGWERDIPDTSWRYAVGYYRNSYHRNTFYAGGTWMPISLGEHVKAGTFVGVATGYWTPVVAMPMVSVTYGPVGLNIGALPTFRNYVGYVAAQMTVRVD